MFKGPAGPPPQDGVSEFTGRYPLESARFSSIVETLTFNIPSYDGS